MRITLVLALLLLSAPDWDRSCQLGPGVQIRVDTKEGVCLFQDLDHDGDVDQDDLGLAQRLPVRPETLVFILVIPGPAVGPLDPEATVREALNERFAKRGQVVEPAATSDINPEEIP